MSLPDAPVPWTGPDTSVEIDDSWYIRSAEMPVRLSAGGVIIRWEGPELMVALTRVQDGPVPIVELPRGGIELGETAEQAARREIFEETGLEQCDLLLPEPFAAHGRAGFRKGIWIECCWYLYLTLQVHAQPSEMAHELLWSPFDRPGPLFWPGEQRMLTQERSRVFEIATAARTAR